MDPNLRNVSRIESDLTADNPYTPSMHSSSRTFSHYTTKWRNCASADAWITWASASWVARRWVAA